MKSVLRATFNLTLLTCIVLAVSLIVVGCNSSDDNPTTVDTTAPGPVTGLTATAQADAVVLTWTNPNDPDFNGVQVRRDTLTTPTASTGTLLFTGMTSDFTDHDITPGQSYIYAVFAYDAVGNIASPTVTAVGTNAPIPVTFADPELEAAVRQALNIPTGDILATDMLDLTELDISRLDISSIFGLQYALNLGKLEMESLQLVPPNGLEALTSLTKLWELDIRHNRLTSLPDLKGLPLLRHLYLEGNDIGSLRQFAGMPALVQLSVGGASLSDLSPLAQIPTLITLQIFDSAVTDLSPLAGLGSLTSLGLFVTPLDDISPLATMTRLQNISLVFTQVGDLGPLANMTDLRYVDVPHNPNLHDLQPLVDNASFGANNTLIASQNPLLHDAVAVQIPALEARGVIVVPMTGLPTAVVGIWEPQSAVLNGVDQDLATFFDWEATTVTSNLFLYFNNTYAVHNLDGNGGDTYSETGAVTVSDQDITLHELTENGVEIPDGSTMIGTWAMNGDDLVITQTDGADTAVITWTRLPE